MKFFLSFTVLTAGLSVLASSNAGNIRRKPSQSYSPQKDVLLEDIHCPHKDAVLFSLDTGTTTTSGKGPTQSRRSTVAQPPRNLEGEIPSWSQLQERSEIPMDPAITYGELDNGMQYYVRPNGAEGSGMELRLHIDAGANFETEEERGLAHFLEHMMFQTTESYSESGSLIPALQRLGIAFGIHLNAYTSMEETVYTLSLPNTDEDTLSAAYTWMKDIMGGALLEDSEIEAERGVVVSELQLRDSVESRLTRELYKWVLPDSLVSQRFVIGTEDTINGLTRDMFVQFYEKYYVPRRATFIAVGGMNATDMVALIEDTFGGLLDAGDRGEDADYGSAPEGLGLQTKVFMDEELGQEQIVITTAGPAEHTPDTELGRYESMVTSIAIEILSTRLQVLGIEEGSPILAGGARSDKLYDAIQLYSVVVVPKEGRWKESVAVMEQEWRRALEYGFTELELERVKASRLNLYEFLVLTKDTRDSASLAAELNGAINGGYVVSTPEEDLLIAFAALQAINTGTLLDAFRSHWNTTDINLYLATNTINGTLEDVTMELEELFVESQQVPVEPPIEEERVAWAYTDFGPPGNVISESLVEDLSIRQLILDNNVRVNMKQTNFSAGLVIFRARFGKGQLGQPKNATFLNDFTQFIFSNSGLGQHDIFELFDVSTGKAAGVDFAVTEGDFVMSGGASQEDLEFALQLMTASFVDPAFREEVVGWWQARIPDLVDSLNSLGGAFQYDVSGWLLGNDERFTAPTLEDLLTYAASDAMDWLLPYLTNSYLEFSIIGDFEEESALDLILQTIGTLPQREDKPAEISAEERSLAIPAPQTKAFTYESKLPQAEAWVVWETPLFADEDIAVFQQLDALSKVFSDRMRIKIREELGGSYAPSAWVSVSEQFNYGFFFASAQGLPEEIEVFTEIILGIAGNLASGDITQDEFERALLPLQSSLVDSERANDYWLNVMDESQVKPYHLDWSRGLAGLYEAMTVDEINALAQQYLSPDLAYPLSIYPVNGSSTDVSKGLNIYPVKNGSSTDASKGFYDFWLCFLVAINFLALYCT